MLIAESLSRQVTADAANVWCWCFGKIGCGRGLRDYAGLAQLRDECAGERVNDARALIGGQPGGLLLQPLDVSSLHRLSVGGSRISAPRSTAWRTRNVRVREKSSQRGGPRVGRGRTRGVRVSRFFLINPEL
jgi:hypothetical protein